jgi:hypothetical protein
MYGSSGILGRIACALIHTHGTRQADRPALNEPARLFASIYECPCVQHLLLREWVSVQARSRLLQAGGGDRGAAHRVPPGQL